MNGTTKTGWIKTPRGGFWGHLVSTGEKHSIQRMPAMLGGHRYGGGLWGGQEVGAYTFTFYLGEAWHRGRRTQYADTRGQ